MSKITFNEKLGIDNDDKKIIEMIEKDPNITHSEIAEEIGKSQPAVGARILKLERKHLLTKQVGLNLKEVELDTAIVQISTRDVDKIIKKLKDCPFINYIFRISGEFNLMVIISASELDTIEKIVDLCFRNDNNVLNVKTNFIISTERTFVIPLDFQIEKFDGSSCGPNCFQNINRPKIKIERE